MFRFGWLKDLRSYPNNLGINGVSGTLCFHEYSFNLKNNMKESELKLRIILFIEMEVIMMDERNGKKNYVPNVFWGKYLNLVLS